jgi:hypothetical protein
MNRWLIAVLLLAGCAHSPHTSPTDRSDICRIMCHERMADRECQRLVYRKMQEDCYGR